MGFFDFFKRSINNSPVFIPLNSGMGACFENEDVSALSIGTVYACVNCIAGAIKSLPLRADIKNEKLPRKLRSLDYLLNVRANPDMSSADAWSAMVYSKLVYGDAYAQIVRGSDMSSEIVGWNPLANQSVTPFRDTETGTKYYRVVDNNGSQRVFSSYDILHLTSLGFGGLDSPSPVNCAAKQILEVVKAQLDAEKRFYNNGGVPPYVLVHPETFTIQQINALYETFKSQREAHSNFPIMYTGGVEPKPIGTSSRDAEVLDSRRFNVEEICRIFGVPPFMIGHTDRNTSWGSGTETMGRMFVTYTLLPHLKQIEDEFSYKLLGDKGVQLKFDTSELERGDFDKRCTAYAKALGAPGAEGWLDADEVRAKEGYAPRGRKVNDEATELESVAGKPADI